MNKSTDWSMRYEKILRKAFNCQRDGDPARLATSSAFNNIDSAKAGLGYSCSILLQEAWLNSDENLTAQLNTLRSQIWFAKTQDDLKLIIEDLSSILK